MQSMPIKHTLYPAIDPSGNNRGSDVYIHKIGPAWTDAFSVTSESAANNTSSAFTIRFSDKISAIDPSSLIVELPVTIVKVGALGPGNDPYQPRAEGFCANPVEKIARTVKVLIDGTSTSIDMSRAIYAIETMDERKLDAEEMNDGLSMIDMCQSYADLWGTNSSPYALPADNTVEANRSTHPLVATYDAVNTTTITSTLLLNLGRYRPFSKKPLFPLSSDSITISFDWESGHLARMWRIDATNHTQPNATHTFTLGQPILHYRLNQMPLGLQSPIHEVYQYDRVVCRSLNTSAIIGAGASSTLSSGTYELSRVPKLMILYLKKSEADFITPAIDQQTADFFAEITSVNGNFGNRTNIFGSFIQYQLYEMSRRNGLISDFSFAQWLGRQGNEVAGSTATGKGSILVIDPIVDIASSGGQILTTGVNMKNVVRFDVAFRNNNSAGHRFDLNLIEIYDSVVEVNNNLGQVHDAITANIEDVIRSEVQPFPVDSLRGGSISSFFKGVWDGAKKVFGFIKPVLQSTKILSTASKLIPHAGPGISSFLSQQGYGEMGGAIAGRAGRRKKK